jgi:cytochrome P450
MLDKILLGGLFVFCILLLVYIWCNIVIYLKRKQYAHIARPKLKHGPLWFLGHALPLSSRIGPDTCFTEVMSQISQELGEENFVLFVIHINFLVILNADIPSKILMNHRVFLKMGGKKDNMSYINGNRVFGERGMVTEIGSDIWYHKRRVMDAAFHKNALRDLVGQMNDISKKLSLYLEESSQKTNLDIHQVFVRVTLETICRCGFNLKDDIIFSEDNLLSDAFDQVFYATQLQFQCCLTFLLPWCFRKEKAALKKHINMIRSSLKRRLNDKIESQKLNKDQVKDMLYYIIKANFYQDTFDVEDVVDDFFVFVIAGTETTAIVMALVLFYMLKNPDIFAKVQAEVSTVLWL